MKIRDQKHLHQRTPDMDDKESIRQDGGPEAPRKRPVLFQYPALPRLEILTYFIILVCTIAYAWSRIYLGSRTYKWNSNGIWESYEDVDWPLIGTHRKDASNFEWRLWTKYAVNVLPWLFGHSILFNLSESILPTRLWSVTLLAYWLIAHVVVTNRLVITVTVIEGLIVYCVARCTRSNAATWIVGVCVLYWSSATDVFVTYDIDGFGYYITAITFPYKMVQYLTFTTEMLQKRVPSEKDDGEDSEKKSKWPCTFFGGLYNMFWYAFYLPYSSHMIVTYKRFPNQLTGRSDKARNWKEIIIFGIRIAVWGLLAEMILYFFYFEAMMSNPDYLNTITKDTLVSVGCFTGQFFHLKYVVIFGLPAFFAHLDKMEPWGGPICISRVTLYSKIWRYFDRGLYDLFKEYMFLPICRPTFSIGRKIFGVLVSYSFVLIWHGTSHQYVVWIVLNIIGLVLESIVKIIYTIPAVRRFRDSYISDRNLRRILAWFQVVTFAFGLYSNFYFLGSSESGFVFVERIFWQETVPVNWPFILLICLGYCFAHVCMEVDRWQDQIAGTSEEKTKKA